VGSRHGMGAAGNCAWSCALWLGVSGVPCALGRRWRCKRVNLVGRSGSAIGFGVRVAIMDPVAMSFILGRPTRRYL
jgi:hypothetical protein